MTDGVFGVRVAGLAFDRVRELRCRRTWALVDELLALDTRTTAEGTALSDALYELIGRDRRPELKPLLVALRRAIHAGRRLDRLDAALAALPDDLAERVAAWRGRRARRAALIAALPDVLATELADRTTALRDLAADPAFQHGLLLSSPTLSEHLSGWLADPAAHPGRPAVIRLAKYLARAAAKTSPFATFTVSGLGRWTPDGPAVSPPQHLNPILVTELHRAPVERMWDLLARRPETRHAVRVRINTGLTEQDGRLCFLGAGAHEPLNSVPSEPSVRALLTRVRKLPHPTLARVDELTGSPQATDRLVSIGLLERRPPFTDQSPDPLGDLIAWLHASHPTRPIDKPPTLRALEELHRLARAPEGPTRHATEVTERREAIVRMGELIDGVLGHQGRPPDKTLCLDTAITADDLALLSAKAWRPVLDDLQTLRRLCGVFDSGLPIKLAAADFFVRHFDGPVPFLRLYRAAHTSSDQLRALLHHAPGRPSPWTAHPAALRRQAWRTLYGRPQNGEGVIVVDHELIGKLTADWPVQIRPPTSLCCYGQAVAAPGGPEFVLNAVYSGHGRHTGRIRHLLGRSGVARPDGPFSPVLECRAGFGTNLNLRPAASSTGLDYPFTTTDARLGLTDLWVAYDASTERLTLSDQDGHQMRPVHTGMSSELLLPPAWTFLIQVFGEPPVAMSPAPWPDARTEPVHRRPRLQLGRVVLARAAWRLPAGAFPIPAKGENEAAYLPRLARWLNEHRLPRRFFARLAPRSPGEPVGRKSRKPLYVDVTDHLQLLSLIRSLRGTDDLLVLEEALPDPADAPDHGPHGSRVTEYVFEVGQDHP
ncbi:lantibiotic dehydratase [Actinomadura oligospora]|uniref:lantibiotic dehydratase n=1 Tax=Actinomadura oligospora TaxID=111804 RepID=UPI00047C7C3C|nr:lantibiotic dehydratase [Actinomadura oligospora]